MQVNMSKLHVIRSVVTTLLIFGSCLDQGKADCIVNIRSALGSKCPLLMRKDATTVMSGTRFPMPTTSEPIVSVLNGEEVELLCAGNDNRLNISGTISQQRKVIVKCDTDAIFEYDGQLISITDFQCTSVPQSNIREDGTCTRRQKKLQIGYEISSNRFIPLIDICFDDINYNTYYLNYTLFNAIQKRQQFESGSPTDRVDYYNNLPGSPENYYTCSNQQTTVGRLVGSSRVNQYIKCSSNVNYVAETHLAAVSDFTYFAQQESSKYYVNVVPMWNSIKNGNWLKLEEEIRQYASNTSRAPSDLVIFSGTLGVTDLDKHGIYLGKNQNNLNVIPVPKWIWKLVYEPDTKKGIVFLVVNNPYKLSFTCSCVCAQTKWTRAWNRSNRYNGYVFCCTVNNFRSVFSGLPNFNVTGLLTKDMPYRPPFPDIPAQ